MLISRLLGTACVFGVATLCGAQVIVQVNDGETITRDDLLAGVFNGQTFTLGPDTIFQINAGGAIDASDRTVFVGSKIDVRSGGTCAGGTRFVDVDLLVRDGGGVGDIASFGDDTFVRVDGGSIGSTMYFEGESLTMSSGSIGEGLIAYGITMTGGTIGADAQLWGTSEIAGGVIGPRLQTYTFGEIRVTGGHIGDGLRMFNFGDLIVDGGSVGNDCRSSTAARVELISGSIGDDFVLLGERSGKSTLRMTGGSIGDRFRSLGNVEMHGGTIGADAEFGHRTEITGGRIGDGMTYRAEGTDEFGRLIVRGGEIGDGLDMTWRNDLTLHDGVIGNGASTSEDGNTEIRGGSIGDDFLQREQSPLLMVGGAIGDRFESRSGVEMRGGAIGAGLTIDNNGVNVDGVEFRMSGGSLGDAVGLLSGAKMRLRVDRARLDGEPIQLFGGDVIEITERVVVLDVTFDDGSVEVFLLLDQQIDGIDFFAADAVLLLEGNCRGDWDDNGTVNANDVSAFLNDYFADLSDGGTRADFNRDGVTNAADVGGFLSVYFREQSSLDC